ncbi:hypothetical protein RIVM261_084270 [Rivularia sp. IAM M-261]|nr:hypothetical protein RIVM261_084270 [Rivularia sp. IAM M-261]
MKFDGGDNGIAQFGGISGRVFSDRGTGVRVRCEDFLNILSRNPEPLVIVTAEGFFTKLYKYATAYKGFVFFTESLDKLELSNNIEVIQATSISSEI